MTKKEFGERLQYALTLPADECVREAQALVRSVRNDIPPEEFGNLLYNPAFAAFCEKYRKDILDGKFDHVLHPDHQPQPKTP